MTDAASAHRIEQAETMPFSAEVDRLLDLVVHSLYSEREIFLRELVANAADATDRRRFEALSAPELGMPEAPKVRIEPDRAARTLTISDQGIGMSRQELIENLGTIARSGTQAFAAALAANKAEERAALIGQFGVGFYSAFMVADKVEVISRRAGTEEAWRWISEGRGNFQLLPATREQPGTDVVLHLKADAEEFLDPWRLESIVRKWADHITLPIVIVREGKESPANEGTALWRKPKSEVSEESVVEFYRHLGHLFGKPWATLHWKAEGALEFYAMLFIPSERPFDLLTDRRTSHLRLHVRRMFITDEAELLPPWLRFVQGVVDSEDLPLNVSREMLQATPILPRIRKALTNRVLTELKARAKEPDYETFWQNFGAVVKEGLWDDPDYQDDIAAIARFRSTAVEGWTSLADYLSRMREGQEAIYVQAGESIEALRASPQLEGFRARGIEVLLLSDPIDAFWPDRFTRFEGKPIRRAAQSAADLEKFPLSAEQKPAEAEPDLKPLLAAMTEALKDQVSEVRASGRLVESAVALVPAQHGPDLYLQRMMRRAGRNEPLPPPVLEINPQHALIRLLASRAAQARDVAEAARVLLDLARLQEGEPPADLAGFSRIVSEALARAWAETGQ
jgi:molecular chaperone HtpG